MTSWIKKCLFEILLIIIVNLSSEIIKTKHIKDRNDRKMEQLTISLRKNTCFIQFKKYLTRSCAIYYEELTFSVCVLSSELICNIVFSNSGLEQDITGIFFNRDFTEHCCFDLVLILRIHFRKFVGS